MHVQLDLRNERRDHHKLQTKAYKWTSEGRPTPVSMQVPLHHFTCDPQREKDIWLLKLTQMINIPLKLHQHKTVIL